MKESANSVNKFLLSLYEKNKKEIRKITAVALIGSVLAAVIPYIYGRLFDLALVPQTSLNLLISLIAVWFTISIVSNYTTNKTGLMGDLVGAKISLEVEADAYSHFLSLPISFHKKQQKGEILQKISRGAWTMKSMIEEVSYVLPQFLIFIFSLIAMFIIQWSIAVILVVVLILSGFITIRKIKPILAVQEEEHKIFDKTYGEVYDKLYNVYLVKNFAMEENERKNLLKSFVEKLTSTFKKSSTKWTGLSITQDILYSIGFVSVLGAAIFFLRFGRLTPGEFIMLFGYVNLAFGPFRTLFNIYRLFKKSSVAIKRFIKLQRIVPEAMKHGNKTLDLVKGEISFKNVSFGYIKGKEILKNINLRIKPGETVALIGKSGVGKTTLSELIIGYYKPKEGKIMLDGTDISKLKLKWLREQIAIVPQDLNLFNDTLINNLKYANPKASFEDIVTASRAASADEFIKELPKQYKTLVGERGVKLSMGQRQRIAIAMAFLKNPKILILDEPTAALDAESEKKVQEGINRLIKGKTTIIIAHRFSTVRNADKIVVLDKGKIVELGNHRELIRKKGIYYDLYKLQKGMD
ncbi:MAG TPA: ABC transporter ATP-binding protein [Candidatus Pacearchaeota archaeon]|nr:ABC transporter ATP-binding protein [Candidatus Pacearchaeota archaeon]